MNNDFSNSNFIAQFQSGDWDLHPEQSGNLLLRNTEPGYTQIHYENVQTLLQEFIDNDIRAAHKEGTHFDIGFYKENVYGPHIVRTWASGPGHGDENAKRFAHCGFVDTNKGTQQKLGASCYGYGQTQAQKQACNAALNVSISKPSGRDAWQSDNMRVVHWHWYSFLGVDLVKTIRCTYHKNGNGWRLVIDPDILSSFLELSQKNTFVDTVVKLEEILEEVSPNGETGVARFLIGIRDHFERLFDTDTDESGEEIQPNFERVCQHFADTLYVDRKFTFTIFGHGVEPKHTISELMDDTHTFEIQDGDISAVVMIGLRATPSGDLEPDDDILNGPIIGVGDDFNNFRSVTYDFNVYTNKRKKMVVGGTKWRWMRILFDKKLAVEFSGKYKGHHARAPKCRIAKDLCVVVLLKSARACNVIKTRLQSVNIVPICDQLDFHLSDHLEYLWVGRPQVFGTTSIEGAMAKWRPFVAPSRKRKAAVSKKSKNGKKFKQNYSSSSSDVIEEDKDGEREEEEDEQARTNDDSSSSSSSSSSSDTIDEINSVMEEGTNDSSDGSDGSEDEEEEQEEQEEQPDNTSKKTRRGFLKSVQQQVWDKQFGNCYNPHCRKVLSRTTCEHDHKDGASYNNNVNNLWILCRECHGLKTNVQQKKGRSFSIDMLKDDDYWGNAHIRELNSILSADPDLTPSQIEKKRMLIQNVYAQMIR